MNTFFETYRPFSTGPTLVRIVRPFVANDFDFGPVGVYGPEDAASTFGPRGRRTIEAGRKVELTEETETAILDDLKEMWKDSTNFSGKEYKRRWNDGGTFHSRTPPGFDQTFADFIAYGISSRLDLNTKTRKQETRQLELDATRERARRNVDGAVPMADWVMDYNRQWQEYADWTAEKLIDYVADLVKEVRVKSEWLEENQTAEDNERIEAMSTEIDEIDQQIKVLRERKRMLKQRIYDKDRATFERHLKAQQDPVLQALFTAAIEKVAGEKSSNISHPLFD